MSSSLFCWILVFLTVTERSSPYHYAKKIVIIQPWLDYGSWYLYSGATCITLAYSYLAVYIG